MLQSKVLFNGTPMSCYHNKSGYRNAHA